MMQKFSFSPKELEIIETIPARFGRDIVVRKTPVTPRRNTEATYFERKPCWMPSFSDFSRGLASDEYNNKLGRGHAEDITDCFGIQWQYVPTAGGSIVRPGSPTMEDANDWKNLIKIPDVDSWDWEGMVAANPIDTRFACEFTFINGFWFERLISFMDFMGAAMALIDEDQEDALKELFEATTKMGCKFVDKFCEYFPQLDGFNIHDDWGAQKAPFFSEEVARKFFVPMMKKITDHIHSKGRFVSLHSCGHNEERIQCYIDGGFDYWEPQPMNDCKSLYENYGDKIILGVWPDRNDIGELSEEEQRAEARKFADTYCKPGKPAVLGIEGSRRVTTAFIEELYTYSRLLYLNM